jgi:hypothetical protein
MKRRAFVDGFFVIVLALVALGFLFYFALRSAPAPAKPAQVVRPANQPAPQPQHAPPSKGER